MAVYDLYGFLSADINEVKNFLEDALSLKFDAHESSYQGGDYFRWGENASEHFILKNNVDPFDGEPAEMAFAEYPILFYVNDTLRSADLHEQMLPKIENFILLRHEEL